MTLTDLGLESAGIERKNRVNQPEDGRETRGIQNEHNVGLRRTRAPAALKPEPKFINSKIKVTVGQFLFPVGQPSWPLQLCIINHSPLFLSTLLVRYK